MLATGWSKQGRSIRESSEREITARMTTLCALLPRLGITRDSSFAPGIVDSHCDIDLPLGRCEPTEHCGVEQWPIAAIAALDGWRHGQITALSFAELRAAVTHAAEAGWPACVLVSHSFELFNRKKGEPNPMLVRRFERFCEWLGESELARGCGTEALSVLHHQPPLPLLTHSVTRTVGRMVEQLLANRF